MINTSRYVLARRANPKLRNARDLERLRKAEEKRARKARRWQASKTT
jgi:hypothetical protein